MKPLLLEGYAGIGVDTQEIGCSLRIIETGIPVMQDQL